MKKSYIKILIFEIIILFILALNIFIQSILNKYLVILFLIILILIFRKIFGTEKIRKRYTKDLIIDITITYLIFFLSYYILGLVTGFYRINNYFTFYGIKTFIIPTILIVVLKEYMRSLICNKYEKSEILYIVTFTMFVMLDLINLVKPAIFNSTEGLFLFLALVLLPAISNNITANYIAKKSNYKVNIFWLLILNMYGFILPIIPNTGDYILSIIRLMLPLIIYFRIKAFYEKEKDREIERNYNKKQILPIILTILIVCILVYFTSGHFRYYAVAVASGSMEPNISRGDVVIIDQVYELKDLERGQILVYKYKNVIVVHRIDKIINKNNKYYFYTKGDANLSVDNYVIKEEDIIGIVNTKVSYIGLPTVWLSEI
jgi:signal peptidase